MSGKQLLTSPLLLIFFLLCANLHAQTTLYPGDIAVLSVSTDMGGACGLPDETDEISFVCFQDIGTGTSIDITDNGWEAGNADMWGDGEGVLTLTRVGPNVPRGTVITIRATNNAGNWAYSVVGLSLGWTIGQTNIPGGPFNLEPGGDQIYFMQGGTWDNHGGGGDDATYDGGTVLYGFNTLPSWNANGSSNQSNLYPDLDGCFHFEGNGSNFYKYIDPLTATYAFEWVKRIDDGGNWTTLADCGTWQATAPVYSNGYTLQIQDAPFGVYCPAFCNRCPPYDGGMIFDLPPGYFFDVVYTNGTDTFEVFGVQDGDYQILTIYDDITYYLVSVTEVNGCPIPPHFTQEAVYMAPYNYPGTHTRLYICDDYVGAIPLNHFLMGDPGGTWVPPLSFGTYWYSAFGEGSWQYTFRYQDPMCPPDTATVKIIFPNLEGTTFEVSCDQNGTPNYIFDDRILITLVVNGNNFSTEYRVTVNEGTITPNMGLVGVPTQFLLEPGSAMSTENYIISIENLMPPGVISLGTCTMDLEIIPPGFCSDPCDYDMTASLTGDVEICPNDCPDNPQYAQIEVSGGTPPYTMDFNVTAPSFPTWTFTEVPVTEFNEIVICVGNVPAAVFDPTSYTLTLPQSMAGNQATITMMNVYDFYNCTPTIEDQEAYVTIYPLPHLDTFAFSVCREFANSVDLTQYDEEINLFWPVEWYDGNPFTVGDQIFNANTANLTNVVQLWALVEDDYCANAIQVPFTILPSPRIDTIDPVNICEGTAVILNAIQITDLWMSNAVYTFHSGIPFDSSTLLDPMYFLPAASDTVFLHATAGTCYDTMPIAIIVQPYPDFTLEGTPCQLALNNWTALFTSDADSIIASVGIVTNNASGQDMISGIPENTNVTIELLNATGLCRDTFLIIAPNCDCPSINAPVPGQASYEVCDDAAIPTFSVTVDPGLVANWYDVPSGGVALLQNSLTYQPPALASAIYYAEAFNAADGCPSLRTPVPFTVHPSAILQNVADPVLCEPNTINLDAIQPVVLNGVGGSGSWFNLANNQPASGVVQPQNGQSWYYVFTSAPGNCLSRDTIVAVVHPLPVMDVYEILCDDVALTYSISFTSDAESVNISAGVLSQVPGTDTFSIIGVAYNTDIQIFLENTSTGCNVNLLQAAPDCSCPPLLQQADEEACSDDGDFDLTTIEGPGVNGTWFLVNTPPGGNPATLNGNILETQNADAGDYVLRFVRSVILDDCVDSALFTFTLHTSPFADAGTDGTSCAPDQIMLTGTGGGSNVLFMWQENGAGNLSTPNSLNTIYTPVNADYAIGSVQFTLTATDQTGFCPAASESITITIDADAYYTLSAGPAVYCDTSDVAVDLDNYISFGTTGGHWFFPDTVSAPITGNSMLIPDDLNTGTYTVFYTTSNAVAPCENDTTGLTLIIENCECPSVALANPTDKLCSESGSQDLDEYLITTESGTWSIADAPNGNQPATLSGSILNTNDSDPGIYTLRYTLTNPVSGCDDFAEIAFEIIASPSIQYQAVECAADLLTWEALIISAAENVTTNGGIITPAGADRYQVSGVPAGASLTVMASNGNGLCTTSISINAPDCDCDLAVSNLPDDVALCPGDEVTLTPTITGGKGTVSSFWIVNNDSIYQTSLDVNTTGSYTFVSKDSLGCEQQQIVDVNVYTTMIADLTSTDVTCPGDADGAIIIFGLQGGTGPYTVSINNGASQALNSFPFEINQLAAGTYTIEFTDASNCTITETIIVQSPSNESLSLGPDQTILVGDSALIAPVISFTMDSFSWSGDVDKIDITQLTQWIKPQEDVNLTLTGFDEKGCRYEDDLHIRVLLSSAITVPNVFSPNDDGINDRLIPSGDPSITVIDYFEIYSRWGELLYAERGVLPNQPGSGWDGKFHNEPMNPGVFLYRLGAKNKKGQELFIYGDVTLVR